MKPKELSAAAKSISDMFVSSRIEGSLEEVVKFDTGSIQINLLNITAVDSNVGPITMPVLKDIGKWCQEKVISVLPEKTVESVAILLNYDSSEIDTNKDNLLFLKLDAVCKIEASRRVYESQSSNKLWYERHT